MAWAACLLALAACTSEETPVETGGKETQDVAATEIALTRAGTSRAPNTTYRVMVYQADGKTFQYTGTYRYAPERPHVLVPCQVDTDGGVVTPYHPQSGVHLLNGTYSMSVVSPALPYIAGTFNPIVVPGFDEPFLVSNPELVTINHYNIYQLQNSLRDMRIRIAEVRFNRGSNLPAGTDFEILALDAGDPTSSVTLVNAGNSGLYHANDRRFEPTVDGDGNIINNPVMPLVAPGGDAPRYRTGGEAYVFATTYGTGGVLPLKLGFRLQMKKGGVPAGHVQEVYVPLLMEDFEMLPSHTYTFNIDVNATWVKIRIGIYDANNWETGDAGAPWSIGDDPETIELKPFDLENWETGNGGTPEPIG